MAERATNRIDVEWYIPTHIERWKSADDKQISKATELYIMNHPEALIEVEAVDFDLITSLFEAEQTCEAKGESKSGGVMADVMSAICNSDQSATIMSGEGGSNLGGDLSGLIDKFLEIKDLKIAVDNNTPQRNAEQWIEVEENPTHNFEDDQASEELAAIYLSQGLFDEAKEIYKRLYLLYSEKSVYFARQIDKIEKNN